MDIGDALWQLWLIYWVSGAVVGSFVGTLLAFGVRGIVGRIIKGRAKRRGEIS